MEQSTSYEIKLDVFEGPFGLLLHLIEKRKLFINDVSLAIATEDYLNYMNKLGGLHSVHSAEISSFIMVASTLILIKSKSLLPNLNLTSEEEGDIRSLEERLRLYELFYNLGEHIKKNFCRRIIFPSLDPLAGQTGRKKEILVFLPDQQITKKNMMTFAKNVLNSVPQKVLLPEVEVKKVVTIEEMLNKLIGRIKNTLQITFKEFAGEGKGSKEEKVTMIVGFLALLELARQGIIQVNQEMDGGDIIIMNNNE
jgi:segregation and condensation protein A